MNERTAIGDPTYNTPMENVMRNSRCKSLGNSLIAALITGALIPRLNGRPG